MKLIAALAAAAALFSAVPGSAVAQKDTRGSRMAVAGALYLDVFADEFARQAAEASMAMIRERLAELAFREAMDLDEDGLEAFAETLRTELQEDMHLLAGDWASLMARNLTLEELQAFARAYEDPLLRGVLSKAPGIMQQFSSSVARLRDVAIRRTLVRHPPDTLMR